MDELTHDVGVDPSAVDPTVNPGINDPIVNDLGIDQQNGAGEQKRMPLSPDFNESQLTRFNLFLTTEAQSQCNFWIGLTRPGSKSPQSLMAVDTIHKRLDEAAIDGISDEAPLMLSDTTSQPSQFLYLMPIPETEFRDRSLWIHNMLQTVKNWQPQTLGLYLHPEVLEHSAAKDLLAAMLTALIETTGIHNYYLLVGSHLSNNLINTALKVKGELESPDREVVVFH